DRAQKILLGQEKKAVLHLHGIYKVPETVIFDWSSYREIKEDTVTQGILKGIDLIKPIIFIGFGSGMDDPNFKGFINWAGKRIINPVNKHYVLVLNNKTTGFPDNV